MLAGAGREQTYAAQSNAIGNQMTAGPPRTIASAISRLEQVNDRLGAFGERLAIIADQLGVLRAVGDDPKGAKPLASGAIERLNHGTEMAHEHLNAIDSLLGAIINALG
ncbi:MAG TPA: hypothetical protein VFX37_15205 [Pseudolabrys sp.]|nr:hypothetical protein [Pseudolabrys sp.]